jgi:hypothetical protein
VSGDGADPDRLAAFWAVAVGDVPDHVVMADPACNEFCVA